MWRDDILCINLGKLGAVPHLSVNAVWYANIDRKTRSDQTIFMVMKNISEVKAQLSSLLGRVAKGEVIVIGKAGKPVAKIVAFGGIEKTRKPGALKGKIKIAADFAELPEDIAAAFGVADDNTPAK
jgi:prevent-host-death family protein